MELHIYLDSKPACMTALKGGNDAANIKEKNNFKYYLYNIKDMFLISYDNI